MSSTSGAAIFRWAPPDSPCVASGIPPPNESAHNTLPLPRPAGMPAPQFPKPTPTDIFTRVPDTRTIFHCPSLFSTTCMQYGEPNTSRWTVRRTHRMARRSKPACHASTSAPFLFATQTCCPCNDATPQDELRTDVCTMRRVAPWYIRTPTNPPLSNFPKCLCRPTALTPPPGYRTTWPYAPTT